jgi:hypothetical protein
VIDNSDDSGVGAGETEDNESVVAGSNGRGRIAEKTTPEKTTTPSA